MPDVCFDEDEGNPVVWHWGAEQKSVPFGHQHLSVKRATTAARDALATLSAIRRNRTGFFAKQHVTTRRAFLRQRFAEEHVASGGAPALTDGVL